MRCDNGYEHPGPFVDLGVQLNRPRVCMLTIDGRLVCSSEKQPLETLAEGPFDLLSMGYLSVCAIDSEARLVCVLPGRHDTALGPVEEMIDVRVSFRICTLNREREAQCYSSGVRAKPLSTPASEGPFKQVSDECGMRPDGSIECWLDEQQNPDVVVLDFVAQPPGGCGILAEAL